MASKLFSLLSLSILLSIAFYTNPSLGRTPPSCPGLVAKLCDTPYPPLCCPAPAATACNSTPYPDYCKSALPNNQSANVYDFARFTFRKSISQSKKFYKLINKYLSSNSTLPISATRALEDCQSLAGLNIEFLSTSFRTVNTTSQFLPPFQADKIQSWLSAVLTNQETCLDGLTETSTPRTIKNRISASLSNDTKLNSVSLAFFTKGWVPNNRTRATTTCQPTRQQLAFRNGRLPLKMSSKTCAVYESVSGRKLLQSSDDQVKVSDIVTVSQDGTGNFTTINDAIAAAPNNTDGSNGYFLVYITEGTYEEYVNIAKNKKYLMLVGDGINRTIITGNHSVVDGWTTFKSATFAVTAPNFIAINITFRNTAGAEKHQAVAVRSGADLSTFYSCSFEGYQDTLYAHSLRQFYRECDIYGTVDTIFGNSAVIFQYCNLYPRLPMSNQFNAITAQGRTDPNQNTGTSIHDCTITPAQDLASSNTTIQTYLGRPWKEYSRTVYMQSFIDSFIDPAGWKEWDGDFALSTLYYAEYDNAGPGSNTGNRVNWTGYHVINATDAANFTVSSFLFGEEWLPQTGVPYSAELI